MEDFKIKGLFIYDYDYYEHQNLVCISRHLCRLESFCKGTKSPCVLAKNQEEHEDYASLEVRHYFIEEVDYI
tara:strand:- start:520 stop:735 length:216 start_codon:yes stop_codon:yes gene_type:complete